MQRVSEAKFISFDITQCGASPGQLVKKTKNTTMCHHTHPNLFYCSIPVWNTVLIYFVLVKTQDFLPEGMSQVHSTKLWTQLSSASPDSEPLGTSGDVQLHGGSSEEPTVLALSRTSWIPVYRRNHVSWKLSLLSISPDFALPPLILSAQNSDHTWITADSFALCSQRKRARERNQSCPCLPFSRILIHGLNDRVAIEILNKVVNLCNT